MLDTTLPKIDRLQDRLTARQDFGRTLNDFGNMNDLTFLLSRAPITINDTLTGMNERRLNNLRNQVSGLDYADLDEILFGRR